MAEFWQTRMGVAFFEETMPALVEELKKLNEHFNEYLEKFDSRNQQKDAPKVWILRYWHRHGTDVTTYTSKERALKAAASLVEEYLEEEIEDEAIRNDIKAQLEVGSLEEALMLYESNARDEGFDITESEVYG